MMAKIDQCAWNDKDCLLNTSKLIKRKRKNNFMKIILICFIKIILNQSFVKNANVMLIKIGLTKMKLSKFITIFTRNIIEGGKISIEFFH